MLDGSFHPATHPSFIPHRELIDELDLMIRARYPLLYIVAIEEEPVENVLRHVAAKVQPARSVLLWDLVRGWDDNGTAKGSAMAALDRVGKAPADEEAIFVLCDLHPVLKNATSDK
ncbi:MAG: AAA family ATPase, partial [Verrucomicrobia bacterium]|nr:AAA family ATPase [Leptolyngbya sp. ES-bin-22]